MTNTISILNTRYSILFGHHKLTKNDLLRANKFLGSVYRLNGVATQPQAIISCIPNVSDVCISHQDEPAIQFTVGNCEPNNVTVSKVIKVISDFNDRLVYYSSGLFLQIHNKEDNLKELSEASINILCKKIGIEVHSIRLASHQLNIKNAANEVIGLAARENDDDTYSIGRFID